MAETSDYTRNDMKDIVDLREHARENIGPEASVSNLITFHERGILGAVAEVCASLGCHHAARFFDKKADRHKSTHTFFTTAHTHDTRRLYETVSKITSPKGTYYRYESADSSRRSGRDVTTHDINTVRALLTQAKPPTLS